MGSPVRVEEDFGHLPEIDKNTGFVFEEVEAEGVPPELKSKLRCFVCGKKGHVNCYYSLDKMDCDVIFKNVFERQWN